MNKEKMGKLLKQCRITKKMTMNNLVEALKEEYLDVTIKTVADWESGNTIPELDRLLFLSNLYGLTVDEILDGEKAKTEEDFDNEYPLLSGRLFEIKDNHVFSRERTEQVKKIGKRFKGLITKYYASGLSQNEKNELHYLFNKTRRTLSDYYEYNRSSSDDFVDFYNVLWLLKKDEGFSNEEEFYWEAQKYLNHPERPFSLDFYTICDEEVLGNNGFVQVLLKQAEPWELDAVVSGFQKFEPIGFPVDTYSRGLDRYKEQHSKEFNREEIYKETLKYLLTHGAMLSPCFLACKLIKHKKVQVIDRLEELYRLCVRPIEIYVQDEDHPEKTKRCFVDNTGFNRFLEEYYKFRMTLDSCLSNEELGPKELYSLITDDPGEEKVIELLAKIKNIDTNRERSRVLADLSLDLSIWRKEKNAFLERESEIEKGLREMKKLESLLEKGQKTFSVEDVEEEGPSKESEIFSFASVRKSEMTYREYNRLRDKKATKSLLEEIDRLTVEEIREKYFPMKEYR